MLFRSDPHSRAGAFAVGLGSVPNAKKPRLGPELLLLRIIRVAVVPMRAAQQKLRSPRSGASCASAEGLKRTKPRARSRGFVHSHPTDVRRSCRRPVRCPELAPLAPAPALRLRHPHLRHGPVPDLPCAPTSQAGSKPHPLNQRSYCSSLLLAPPARLGFNAESTRKRRVRETRLGPAKNCEARAILKR